MNFINQLLKRLIEEFTFKDNVSGADLANMQLINKFIAKYASIIPLKDKNAITIVNAY